MNTEQPERSSDPLEAATEHYRRRSAAFYQLLTEGFPDPEDGELTPEEREVAEEAHRAIGKAWEREVFGDREQEEPGEGSSPDDLQTP